LAWLASATRRRWDSARERKLNTETDLMARIASAFIASVALVAACGPAAAQLESDVYTYSASGAVVADSLVGPGAVVIQRTAVEPLNGDRVTGLDGTAAADQQTLKSRAELYIDSTVSRNYASAKSEVSFSKTVVVDAGSSGLAAGTQLLLNVPLSFDGSAIAGSNALGNISTSYTSTDVSLRYRIVDLDQLVTTGEGGPRPRELMKFGYGARLTYDSGTEASARAGWNGYSTNTASVEGGDADIYQFPVPAAGFIDLGVNTGPLSFDIETFVGHRLQITASLDVFVQVDASFGMAYAAGRYENTFDAGVVSGIVGLELVGETPGVYSASAVPEPSSVLLMLAGLIALGSRLRICRVAA
jgi:PEP-CTERM motif